MEKKSVKKIAIIGAESSGKTWLCEALAKHYNTTWIPEYAREYFHDSDIYNYTLDDLVIIAKKQLELEGEKMLLANKFLFCDTTLITLKIWAELEFKQTPAFIEDGLKKIRYDHYFITDNQIPWVKDELRQNKFSRDLLLEMNVAEVKKTKSPYTLITGKDNERLQKACEALITLY